jgi:hypothetical protein
MRAFNSKMWRIRCAQSMGLRVKLPKFGDFALSACKIQCLAADPNADCQMWLGKRHTNETANPLWIENQCNLSLYESVRCSLTRK